jgi:hypothetical protein
MNVFSYVLFLIVCCLAVFQVLKERTEEMREIDVRDQTDLIGNLFLKKVILVSLEIQQNNCNLS